MGGSDFSGTKTQQKNGWGLCDSGDNKVYTDSNLGWGEETGREAGGRESPYAFHPTFTHT